jgi:hypothetical protein
MRKLSQPLVLSSLLLSLPVLSSRAFAQESAAAAPAVAPAAPSAAGSVPAAPAASPPPAGPPAGTKKASGPALGLSPDAPGQGGAAMVPEPAPVAEDAPTGEWKFDVTGYFRAPLRFSWGPPTTTPPGGGDAGTQFRTPPLVPDANYIDWRYTNSFVAPWTELNFHYGNDRVKSTIQIASYNLTDSGYRRLESNLGINEAFLTLSFPEVINENGRLTLLAGGFTNRYGAAGRYDAGKYETYLFGRTHIVGETLTGDYDVNNDLTIEVEEGFGGKLEPIPFYGPPAGIVMNGNANTDLPAWEPYPGPVPGESTFVRHAHAGFVFKKEVIAGAHLINVFANDNERAGSYQGMPWGGPAANSPRAATSEKPNLWIYGGDVKLIGGVLGEGYLGYSHLSATNALYLADAIEVLHSFGGWQLHDNYFGPPGGTQAVTGTIDSVEFQYSFSFGQLFHYPQAFWGDGPDLIATVFMMYNHVHSPEAPGATTPLNPLAHTDGDGGGHINKLKFGGEVLYVPLPWLGLGGRFDSVRPDLDDASQSFSVFSPRIFLRTAFVTHEQVMLQYSRYFYGSAYAPGNTSGGSQFPYNSQAGASGLGVDKNAAQIAAIIWF